MTDTISWIVLTLVFVPWVFKNLLEAVEASKAETTQQHATRYVAYVIISLLQPVGWFFGAYMVSVFWSAWIDKCNTVYDLHGKSLYMACEGRTAEWDDVTNLDLMGFEVAVGYVLWTLWRIWRYFRRV